MSKVLLKYIPTEALPQIAEWLRAYKVHLKISKSRSSKLGDFRPAFKGKPPRISVNGDLNQYHFLVTLTHEIAHAAVWERYERKALPHGIEWQETYSKMLEQISSKVDFPKDVEKAINRHLQRPKASSCSDPDLYKALRKYDLNNHTLLLEELNEGEVFSVNRKRFFKKGSKRRSRYECIDQQNGKLYLVSGHAEVEPLTDHKP